MKKLITILIIGFLFSCHSTHHVGSGERIVAPDTIIIVEKQIDTIFINAQDDFENSDYLIRERLPDWVLKTSLLEGLKIRDLYEVDNRLNPFYFEEDFNGDGHLDLAISVKEISTNKLGFAVIHGGTNEIFMIGAGTEIKNGLSDDMGGYDVWKVNREKKHKTDLDGNYKEEFIILSSPAIELIKTETGGGIVFWNGKEYAYLHQTC